ncbi:MAG: maleylacetoacetate isomerase [Pseudomonadales bacterium]|nr:maleylacetoacetate isomerase [Pseudomonadales bacterium]
MNSRSDLDQEWVLYDYYRSSAAFRVRIVLNYKNLKAMSSHVSLIDNGGEQFSEAYTNINPQQLIPSLQMGDFQLTQSLAIIEYLEERYPTPAILPGTANERAIIRAFSYSISCDIHPLNNLRVQKYLVNELQCSNEQKEQWVREWIHRGFIALETQLNSQASSVSSDYCFSTFSLADVCLIPQIYNAKRFEVDMSAFPKLENIYRQCSQLDFVNNASPEVVEKSLSNP